MFLKCLVLFPFYRCAKFIGNFQWQKGAHSDLWCNWQLPHRHHHHHHHHIDFIVTTTIIIIIIIIIIAIISVISIII